MDPTMNVRGGITIFYAPKVPKNYSSMSFIQTQNGLYASSIFSLTLLVFANYL